MKETPRGNGCRRSTFPKKWGGSGNKKDHLDVKPGGLCENEEVIGETAGERYIQKGKNKEKRGERERNRLMRCNPSGNISITGNSEGTRDYQTNNDSLL